jgi:hypothetical protein
MVLPDASGNKKHQVLKVDSSEPLDLSIISLWVQVLKALYDPQRQNTESFPEIHKTQ